MVQIHLPGPKTTYGAMMSKKKLIRYFDSVIIFSVVAFFTYQGIAKTNAYANRIIEAKKELQEELYCAAKNIYFEANNQKTKEKKAIMEVVLNRVESSKFPDTICEVVYDAKLDSNGNPIRHKCQFSWFCDGKPEYIEDKEGFEQAYIIAFDVMYARLNGEANMTQNSLWYHADYVSPYWSKVYQKQVQIGRHIFYSK